MPDANTGVLLKNFLITSEMKIMVNHLVVTNMGLYVKMVVLKTEV